MFSQISLGEAGAASYIVNLDITDCNNLIASAPFLVCLLLAWLVFVTTKQHALGQRSYEYDHNYLKM